MADLRVVIFSFTDTEAAAVLALLEDLCQPGSVWDPSFAPPGASLAVGGDTFSLEHRSILAQGNVAAAGRLAAAMGGGAGADLFVFYGCAGVVDPSSVGDVFLVTSTSYASLGAVAPGETVTLRSKWIVHTHPKEVEPLPTIPFPAPTAWPRQLVAATGLDAAHVMATDKVVKVEPDDVPPAPLFTGPAGPTYADGHWTYGAALAQIIDVIDDQVVLVEMESYGIATLMDALGVTDDVVVVRVATDALADKAEQAATTQADMLLGGLAGLALVIERVIEVWAA